MARFIKAIAMRRETMRTETDMRAAATSTGCANSTSANKTSGLEHAFLISFSGTNIVCTSLTAVTLERLVTGACSEGVSTARDSRKCE